MITESDPTAESGSLPNGFTRPQIAAAITPRAQELILLPTERCNLRCSYCYEDFAIGKMSEATQRGIELLLARRVPGLVALRLSWFGGEPLMAKDVVLRLSEYAHVLCTEHGVRLDGGLTTNAVQLDLDLFRRLLAARQNFFQITLDGWGATHDAVRKHADGRGSFERIWHNLVAMRAVDETFEVVIRVHVRRENIEAMPELMAQLGAHFGGDERFRLDFEHVRDLGGVGGASVKQPVHLEELHEIEAQMRRVFLAHFPPDKRQHNALDQTDASGVVRDAKAKGESAGGQRLQDLAAGGNYICYAAKPNSILIRANGRIGKCTVALYDERNDIGCLNADGTFTIDQDKVKPWMRGLSDLDPASLGCPLSGMAPPAPAKPRALQTPLAT
ncbi:MAG: radical protein [Caulobacter sp.]|nr:radical protein [Caulobacter sp.]